MSVVVWDGHVLAADSQGTHGYVKFKRTKIEQLENGDIVSAVGGYEEASRLFTWYKNGAKPEEWPLTIPPVKDEGVTNLIVHNSSGVFVTESYPVFVKVEEEFFAWGSGRDIALGALFMGADAFTAVQAANTFNIYCGGDIKVFRHPLYLPKDFIIEPEVQENDG